MQPEKQAPQGFQWDPTPASSSDSAAPLLYGAAQPNPQGSVQPMMGMGTDMRGEQSTQATAALVVSLVSLVGGIVFFLPFFLAPVSLVLANKSLNITKMYPGHSEHGVARAAQIISAIIVTLLLIGVIIFGLFIALLMTTGF